MPRLPLTATIPPLSLTIWQAASYTAIRNQAYPTTLAASMKPYNPFTKNRRTKNYDTENRSFGI